MLYEGDLVRDVTLYTRERNDDIEGENPFEWNVRTLSDIIGGKRVLIFGLPGAFTPTCSNSQLPGYEEMYEQFKAKGIDEVYCTSVNDAFTMYQWAQHQGIENVKMLPDGNGDLAAAFGTLVSKSNLGFGERSWRYATVIDDMVCEKVFSEDGIMDNCPTDPYEFSAPEYVINQI